MKYEISLCECNDEVDHVVVVLTIKVGRPSSSGTLPYQIEYPTWYVPCYGTEHTLCPSSFWIKFDLSAFLFSFLFEIWHCFDVYVIIVTLQMKARSGSGSIGWGAV